MTQDRVLALPSKGRLKESAEEYLTKKMGLAIKGGTSRGYTADLYVGDQSYPVIYQQARDIAEGIVGGNLAFGVSGVDLLEEVGGREGRDYDILFPLGFGHADLVVAVPDAWVDVRSMSDLGEVAQDFFQRHGRRMRVATKYHRLTRRFFLDHHVHEFRIVDSSGATEGAPYAGQAELIVDITSTGSTLKANDLRVLDDGVMLSSQAVLAASLGWKQTAKDVRLQELFMALHHAQKAARACVLVQVQATRLPQKLREELVNRSLVVAADQGRFVLPRDELAVLVAEGLFAEEHAVSISSLDYASY